MCGLKMRRGIHLLLMVAVSENCTGRFAVMSGICDE